MKLLKTKKAFYDEILRMSKEKPSFFYMATYNLSVENKMKLILSHLPDKSDVRVIIGVNEGCSVKQKDFFKSYFKKYKVKLFNECHLKIIVSNKGVIVGGRNLTDSGWKDLSIKLISRDAIASIKAEFLKHFSKKGL